VSTLKVIVEKRQLHFGLSFSSTLKIAIILFDTETNRE
jgi:hypothetical protein